MPSSYPPPPGDDVGVGGLGGAGSPSHQASHQASHQGPHQGPHQASPVSPHQQLAHQLPSPHAATHAHHLGRHIHSLAPQPQYDANGLSSPTSTSVAASIVASAQHSLQALQAASAAAAAAVAASASASSGPPPAPTLPDGVAVQHQHQLQLQQHHYPPLAPSSHGIDPQHQPQLQQQHHYSPLASPTVPPGGGPPHPTASSPVAKATRLRRACDICSARKVKCDEFGPPCNPCKALGVECTWAREMKRRGPPNKHAEAAKAKRARLEGQGHEVAHAEGTSPDAVPNAGSSAAEALVSIAANGAAALSLASSSRHQHQEQQLDAEAIAPWPTLALLIDDFYTYIHPLIPFPHEPTFRRAFAAREDKTDPEFLALLASMIGCLVASFPRAARLHLKARHNANLFPRAITLIERCRVVALQARGSIFPAKERMTVHDAATSYFLGLAAGYTMQWRLCRRFMAECLSFTREMGYHRSRRHQQEQEQEQASMGAPHVGAEEYSPPLRPVNHVTDEVGKRIFWVMLVGVRSMIQLGASHNELALPPPTPADPYPDLPVEVDDLYITPTEILPQPAGTVSLLTGFNQGIKIYMTMNPIVSVELSYGINSLSWDDQRDMLANCLQAVKHVTDDMPEELRLNIDPPQTRATDGANGATNPNGANGANANGTNGNPSLAAYSSCPPTEDFADVPGYHYVPPAYPDSQPANDLRRVIENQPERRRLLQFEIQKANIYGSQLATRSYYVERCFNLRDAHRARLGLGLVPSSSDAKAEAPSSNATPATNVGAETGEEPVAGDGEGGIAVARVGRADPKLDPWAAERELIVQHLLTVLASIPQRNMEPNGSSLINKIRQVASTLLNDLPERKGPVALKSEEVLTHFLDILMRLEKTGPGPANIVGGGTTAVPASATTADSIDSRDGGGGEGGGEGGGGGGGGGGGSSGSGVMTPMDEEEELRSWADLRECQMRFAQNGGFMTGNI